MAKGGRSPESDPSVFLRRPQPSPIRAEGRLGPPKDLLPNSLLLEFLKPPPGDRVGAIPTRPIAPSAAG